MLLPILLMASFIDLVTWSCVPTPMKDFSIRHTPAAALEHTSSSQRMSRFCVSMVPISQLPKSSSSLWHQPPNLNLQPILSRQERWFPTGKPSSLLGVPNQKALSKQITQPLQVLPIKQLFPAGPKWWICAFWWVCCHASQDQFRYCWDAGSKNWADYIPHQTPPGHLPWSPPKYSCRHLEPSRHMTLPPILPSHWPTGFPLQVFPFHFSFLLIIIPTLWML